MIAHTTLAAESASYPALNAARAEGRLCAKSEFAIPWIAAILAGNALRVALPLAKVAARYSSNDAIGAKLDFRTTRGKQWKSQWEKPALKQKQREVDRDEGCGAPQWRT